MAGHEVILKQERTLQGLTEEEKKDYGLVMKSLQKYCTSQGATNEVFERFVFHQGNQEPGEPFDHFYDAIQDLVKTCNYKEPSKELRDRIVHGILDKTLQETFLKTRDLTEELVVQACRATKSARLQVQKMNAPEVHHVSPEKSKNNGGNGGKKNNNETPSKIKNEDLGGVRKKKTKKSTTTGKRPGILRENWYCMLGTFWEPSHKPAGDFDRDDMAAVKASVEELRVQSSTGPIAKEMYNCMVWLVKLRKSEREQIVELIGNIDLATPRELHVARRMYEMGHFSARSELADAYESSMARQMTERKKLGDWMPSVLLEQHG
ncbi:Polyribonucleotide nucleotidyltransferase [Frankliniella fusca]|uniref:Polyribonucleotide nucleotidyltransferase n=1 Tax=Frankliniella fusca TaxID=407009 RepID=A0AAE1HE97_9NEOP|nr:Polyribonucleotide nucleotidyltransferase [Frankliniella fusca]